MQRLTPAEVKQLKDEVQEIIEGQKKAGRCYEYPKEKSEALQKLDDTLTAFKDKAASGEFSREGQQVGEVMEICAGCRGLSNGEDYRKLVPYTDVYGNAGMGYELNAKWETG